MTRRSALLFPALPAAIDSLQTIAQADPNRPRSIKELWDDFTAVAVAWVPVENELLDTPGISPIQAQRQWEVVRRAFHELDVAVRNQ